MADRKFWDMIWFFEFMQKKRKRRKRRASRPPPQVNARAGG